MESQADDTRTAKAGRSASHDYFRVPSEKLIAQPFTCSHCSRQSAAIRHRCLTCHNVSFCGGCHESASQKHAGHGFEKVDAASRVAALRATGPPEDPPEMFWYSVPRAGCPTCFGQRPDLIVDLPSWWDIGQLSPSWTSPHDVFTSDFEVSSIAGCRLCSLVHRALMEVAWLQDAASTGVGLSVAPEQISIRARRRLSDPLTEAIIRPRVGCSPPWRTMTPAPHFPPSFESRECFQRLRGWLDECRTKHKHPRCQESRDTRSDPGRLLYVGHDLDSRHLRLVSTKGRQHSYVALTHCWGTETFMKTTTANVDAFHQHLEQDILPQSFKDAIRCAKAIGVDHVWIDALCIVQDDISDWQRESVKMRDIYGNAVLVVVADSAPNAASGFLGTRRPGVTGIPVELHDDIDSHEFVVQRSMDHFPGFTASRAWCLQEIVLARRCVIFSSEEMRWECNSFVTCECGGNKSPFVADHDVICPSADFIAKYALLLSPYEVQNLELASDEAIAQLKPFSKPRKRPFQNLDSEEDVYNDWRLRAVNTFNRMQLTRSTDRLPALSGFASLVGARLEDRYLAGLWLADLPLALLWYVQGTTDGPLPAPAQYYGPSFSWVSVDGLAKYSYLSRTADAKSIFESMILSLHHAECCVPGQNPYGEVTAGEIRLTGLLRTAVMTKEVKREPQSPELDALAAGVERSAGPRSTDRTRCTYRLQIAGFAFHPSDFSFYPDTSLTATQHPSLTAARATQPVHEPFSVLVNILLIGKTRDRSEDIYAAIVLGLSSSRPGAYERLGIMEVRFLNDEPDGREWVESFESGEILLV